MCVPLSVVEVVVCVCASVGGRGGCVSMCVPVYMLLWLVEVCVHVCV